MNDSGGTRGRGGENEAVDADGSQVMFPISCESSKLFKD
jgi:hypothetical protein